jgi:hypothetical protein
MFHVGVAALLALAPSFAELAFATRFALAVLAFAVLALAHLDKDLNDIGGPFSH